MVEFSNSIVDRVNVLKVQGALQQPAVEEFYDRMEAAAPIGNIDTLVVDCTNLTKISSWGMRALCLAHKDLKHRGQQMMIAGLTGDVRETFQISGVDSLLNLCDDVETALGECNAGT